MSVGAGGKKALPEAVSAVLKAIFSAAENPSPTVECYFISDATLSKYD